MLKDIEKLDRLEKHKNINSLKCLDCFQILVDECDKIRKISEISFWKITLYHIFQIIKEHFIKPKHLAVFQKRP